MIPDLLRAAADAIEVHGWSQRKDIDPATGGLCANGALRVAAGHTTYTDVFAGKRMDVPHDWTVDQAQSAGRRLAATHAVLNEYLANEHGYSHSETLPSIIRYNDHVARAGREVASIMRATASWVESHPERELHAIAETARKNYLFPEMSAPSHFALADASV